MMVIPQNTQRMQINKIPLKYPREESSYGSVEQLAYVPSSQDMCFKNIQLEKKKKQFRHQQRQNNTWWLFDTADNHQVFLCVGLKPIVSTRSDISQDLTL